MASQNGTNASLFLVIQELSTTAATQQAWQPQTQFSWKTRTYIKVQNKCFCNFFIRRGRDLYLSATQHLEIHYLFVLSHLPDTVGKTRKLRANGSCIANCSHTRKKDFYKKNLRVRSSDKKTKTAPSEDTDLSFCADNLYLHLMMCYTAKNFFINWGKLI